jgi:hypothetical protein
LEDAGRLDEDNRGNAVAGVDAADHGKRECTLAAQHHPRDLKASEKHGRWIFKSKLTPYLEAMHRPGLVVKCIAGSCSWGFFTGCNLPRSDSQGTDTWAALT